MSKVHDAQGRVRGTTRLLVELVNTATTMQEAEVLHELTATLTALYTQTAAALRQARHDRAQAE